MKPDNPNNNGNVSNGDNKNPEPQEIKLSPCLPVLYIKTLMVAIDFSDSSKIALRYAAALAHKFQARLILVHVVEFSLVGSELGALELAQIQSGLEEEANKQIQNLVADELPSEIESQTVIRTGKPYSEIVHAAEEFKVDLLIIATHGHSTLTKMLLGSTAERVVRHANCPVLIIPRSKQDIVL